MSISIRVYTLTSVKIKVFLLGALVMLVVRNPVLASDCASTDFSLKLFSAVAQDSKENIVISPFSAYMTLSMVLNGAAGSTRDQIAKVLGITSDAVNQLNEKNHAACAELNNSDKVKLKIASIIFADKSTPFKTSFIDTCKQIYDAKAECLDFKNSSAVLNSVNTWCNTRTEGKIPVILDQLDLNDKMVVLNAVYFKGSWANAFKTNETQDDKFITASDDLTDIKMMHQREHFLYFKGDNFKAISMPYAGDRQSLIIFLPNKKVPLSLFQAKLTANNWHEWMANFRSTDVNLSLPKFTINCLQDFSAKLKTMGMAEAFDCAHADFSKLVYFSYKAWISQVLQKTYMDIDERGTEAAAATAVKVSVLAVGAVSPQPVEFRVDHPFILALIDNDTQEILFLGAIVKP